MKTIRFISVLSVAAVFASCAKEETPIIEKSQISVISATIEQPTEENVTKTALGSLETGKGYPINWSTDDAIAVSSQEGKVVSLYTLEAGYAGRVSGIFTGGSLTGSVYAYYPYSHVKAVDNATYSVIIPTKQTYVDGSTFANCAMPMYASATDIEDGLRFKPLMSVLKLQLTGSDVSVSKIFVSAAAHSTMLSGRATVNMDDGTLIFGEGFDYVELDCAEPVALSDTESIFHIVVPANATAMDYRVKIVTSDGQIMNKDLTDRTFARQIIKKMASLPFAPISDFPYIDGLYSGTGVNIAGIVMAPANCGQLSSVAGNGLLYQWGRKYGQSTGEMSGGDFITSQSSSMAGGSDVAVKDKFYRGYLCWYKDGTVDDKWWSNYDPCPAGWRVPTNEEMTILKTKYELGGTFTDGSNTVKLPLVGCRNGSGGGVEKTNVGCYLSSVKSSGSYAYMMSFTAKSELSIGTAGCAQAASVRCVQE